MTIEDDKFMNDGDRRLIEREWLKIYVDTFSLMYENVVDSSLDEALNIQRESNIRCIKGLIERSRVPASGEEDRISKEQDRFYDELYMSNIKDIAYALYELKIMYAYKYFEIQLKKLSQNSFKDWPQRRMFKWPEILKFYDYKNIRLEELGNYVEVDQLRNVNNSLKHHDGEVEEEIINLPEFKGCEYVAYFGGEVVNPNNPYVLFCKDNEVIDTLKLDENNRFFTI